MRRSSIPSLVTAAALAALVAPAALAITMDGQLDAAYGPALVTQTTQTSALDNALGQVGHAYGSELDAAYGVIADGVLHLFLAGDVMYYEGSELQGHFDQVEVFIDSKPGGQNVLGPANPVIDYNTDLNVMAGLAFDTGFAADYWLGAGCLYSNVPLRVYWADLPTAGGGSGYYAGTSTPGGPGTLAFGSNPNGFLATLDDRNVAGVTAGCGAAAGGGVTTGIELAIPLAAIGDPTGCVEVTAFIANGTHSRVSNQVLGPVPVGTCELGNASSVNFASIPGPQHFTVCPGATSVSRDTWGRLKAIYR